MQIIQIIQVCFHALHGLAGRLHPSARPEPTMGGKAPHSFGGALKIMGLSITSLKIYRWTDLWQLNDLET